MTALLVPIDSIVIAADRQRREFDLAALNELGEGIKRNGLLHAPVVRFQEGATVLVAGERRLRAIKDIQELGGEFRYAGSLVPPGLCPIVPLGELSPLEAEEAELEENIRRVDLSWQERASASARMMRLRTAQAHEAGLPPPTVSDIAREVRNIPESSESARQSTVVGLPQTETRNEIIVARHPHDPEVAAAKSLGDAMKLLKKREEVARHQQLATTVGQTFTSKSHRLIQGDSLAWLRDAAPAQFDIILTDPPYGMGADEFGDSGRGLDTSAHFYADDYETWKQIMAELPARLFLVAKEEAHAYLFCDIGRFPELSALMSAVGWKVFRTPLIWYNPDGYRAPWPDQGAQRKYEAILYAVKGNRKVLKVAGDVIECRKDKNLGHPAQKPVILLQELLRRSALPGNTVFDPFMGSGSTVEACHELKLPCTGLEMDQAAYGIAVKRVQGLSATDEGLF